jgi:hypothetical protein
MALGHRALIYIFKTLMLGECCMAFGTQSEMLMFGKYLSGHRATTYYYENTQLGEY